MRHGSVMSPTQFIIYLEELLVKIRKSREGVEIGGGRLWSLADAVLEVADKYVYLGNEIGKE